MHFAAGERVDEGGVVAVYDLGGGTFDAAVLRRDGDRFVTLGQPQGIERLGGIDFDEAVMSHVRATLGDALTSLDGSDPVVRSGNDPAARRLHRGQGGAVRRLRGGDPGDAAGRADAGRASPAPSSRR